MRITQPNYTQTPNDLFDHWLPHLGEVELKVLLVVMRKTFGWHKIRDKISISQLQQLTGSSATHVLIAVKSLIEKRIIIKIVSGNIGQQQTHYELVVHEDSNNCYPCPKVRGTPDNLSGTKERATERKEQQQQRPPDKPPSTASPAAAVSLASGHSSGSSKPKPTPREPATPKPPAAQQPKIYASLQKIDIPERDKIEITARYSEECVKNAIAYATSDQTKITKGLCPAIKWACQTKPEVPKNAKDEFAENRAYAMRYDGAKGRNCRFDCLSSCVEIVYIGSQKNPFCLSYSERGFREQLDSQLRKDGFKILI